MECSRGAREEREEREEEEEERRRKGVAVGEQQRRQVGENIFYKIFIGKSYRLF